MIIAITSFRSRGNKFNTLILFLKEDIEYLFSKGIQIDHLVKMDVVMGEIIAASPELDDLHHLSIGEQYILLYRATQRWDNGFPENAGRASGRLLSEARI